MTATRLSCIAACALILGAVGCDKVPQSRKPAETREQKAKNIGDQYVRGVLGTGNNAKGTVEIAAISKAIQMYQMEKGQNPSSLAALQSAGYLSKAPTAPPGKKFEYNASSGSVKLVAK